MEQHYIYKITNTINGNYYYGKRSCKGLAIDDYYMGSGKGIILAIKKYGKENFTKEILAYCESAEDALELEELVVTDEEVKSFKCYNRKTGGSGGIQSEDVRKIISEKQLGRNPWNKGKTGIYSEYTLQKMSEAKKGVVQSKETVANRALKLKGRIGANTGKFGKDSANSKGVYQICLTTNTIIAEYHSLKHATEITGIPFRMISRVCNGIRQQTHGYSWKFIGVA